MTRDVPNERDPQGSSAASRPGDAPATSAVDPSPTEVIPRVPAAAAAPAVAAPAPGATIAAARKRRRGRVLRRVFGTLAALLVVLLVGGWFFVYHLNRNIIELPAISLQHPTDTATFDPVTNLPPTNILLMGSDTRAGAGNSEYGDAKSLGGPRSDVQMVAHLSANRKFATIVSIPRDTMVKGPSDCNFSKPQSQWEMKQFNEYFTVGGYQCTARIIANMTGLYIDDAAIVDFNGFKEMVNALGTVPVCLTKPVKDDASGANFPAGRQRLNGEQALAFVRVRHNIGDNSDIGRIKRQQDFLSSMIREATSKGVLLNPAKALPFIDAATKALSTTPNLHGVQPMLSLLSSVHDIQPANISFVSMPWMPDPQNSARVLPSPAAAGVWKILREDKPWPGTPAAKEADASSGSSASASSSSASPTPTATATVSPKSVVVDVVNASGLEGIGTQSANALTAQGFVVASVTNSTTTVDGVVIHHSAADKAKAEEVAAAFPGATLKADGVAGQALRVEVGLGAPKVVLVPNAPKGTKLPAQAKIAPPMKSDVQAKTADQDICSDTSSG